MFALREISILLLGALICATTARADCVTAEDDLVDLDKTLDVLNDFVAQFSSYEERAGRDAFDSHLSISRTSFEEDDGRKSVHETLRLVSKADPAYEKVFGARTDAKTLDEQEARGLFERNLLKPCLEYTEKLRDAVRQADTDFTCAGSLLRYRTCKLLTDNVEAAFAGFYKQAQDPRDTY